MISVKICGITSARDAEICVQAGARALGFVFYGRSPRAVSPGQAREIGRALPKGVKRVGVFVNVRNEVIEDIADRAGLDMVQLSGDEEPHEVNRLAERRKVIKAFRPRFTKDLEKIAQYVGLAGVLIDSGSPESVYGGSGQLVDFALAREAKRFAKSLILAGGLNAATVTRALREVGPSALDVCSGVESEPGKKDPKKVKGLFDALWRYDEEVARSGGMAGRHLGEVVKAIDPPRPKQEAGAADDGPSDLVDEIK